MPDKNYQIILKFDTHNCKNIKIGKYIVQMKLEIHPTLTVAIASSPPSLETASETSSRFFSRNPLKVKMNTRN